ncbi:hypothetical protein LP414_00460 [Polaromonas sp. P1(28)-13]|nr:hypothetical protein LP414_00460 [Polaromonas sp. P1(28)-13]
MKNFNPNLRHLASAFALALFAVTAFAQDAGFADELKDYSVSATKYPRSRSSGYSTATPTEIPGAKVVTTKDLIGMLASETKPIVVAAYGAQKTVAGGSVMDGAGEDRLLGPDKEKFATALSGLTAGDKSKPIVFYCPDRNAGFPITRLCMPWTWVTPTCTGIEADGMRGKQLIKNSKRRLEVGDQWTVLS